MNYDCENINQSFDFKKVVCAMYLCHAISFQMHIVQYKYYKCMQNKAGQLSTLIRRIFVSFLYSNFTLKGVST